MEVFILIICSLSSLWCILLAEMNTKIGDSTFIKMSGIMTKLVSDMSITNWNFVLHNVLLEFWVKLWTVQLPLVNKITCNVAIVLVVIITYFSLFRACEIGRMNTETVLQISESYVESGPSTYVSGSASWLVSRTRIYFTTHV